MAVNTLKRRRGASGGGASPVAKRSRTVATRQSRTATRQRNHVARKRYSLVQMADIPPTPCPCGQARRAFTDEPEQTASLHITEIKTDSQVHYHKKMTEFYYILEGAGTMELDGEIVPIKPGSAIMIRPGCRHRAVGKLKVLIVPVPAFDHRDEWFD